MDFDDEFLKWEHTTAARAEFLWAIASLPLVRAADGLWERAAFASRVAADVFAPPIGVVDAPERRLTDDELDALQDHGVGRVAIMLLGLAIENAAKTLIVRAEPEAVAHDGEWKLKSHDLITLVERAGRSTSEDDKFHLRVLADYVQWAGRYPVPLSAIGKGSPGQFAALASRSGDCTPIYVTVKPRPDGVPNEYFATVARVGCARASCWSPRSCTQASGGPGESTMTDGITSSQTVHRWYTRPVFFVSDVSRAARFYVDVLGFEKAWHSDGGAGKICQVTHGECELILCEDTARRDRGRLFIELTSQGFAGLRREFAERSVPIRETWWGYDTIQVDDPDGNELFFPRPD